MEETKLVLPEELCAAATEQLLGDGRLLTVFVDLDGTLAPFAESPEGAGLTADARSAIRTAAGHERLDVIVLSAREDAYLAEQLRGLGVSYAAEHGAVYYSAAENRSTVLAADYLLGIWRPAAMQILSDYLLNLDGSRIEEKPYSLTFHYRLQRPAETVRIIDGLLGELASALAQYQVRVVKSTGTIEIFGSGIGKELFTEWFMWDREHSGERRSWMALTANPTGEAMFGAVERRKGISVKVGAGPTKAQFRLAGPAKVMQLLSALVESVSGFQCIKPAFASGWGS